MKRLILIILSTFVFLAGPALASGNDAAMWIVSQRSGDARVVRSGLQPASLKVSAALRPGDVIMTGPTGRATLARGSDYIVVAPRSELRLPATQQVGGFTRVVQTIGTMLFKVRHTGVPHFAVDTPMLAAVVKGTTFTIIVDKDRSAVQVIEGAVEVTATDGGMKGLIEGGRTVFIDRHEPKLLITADAASLGTSDSPSDDSVKISGTTDESLSAVVDLTGGLVRAEAAPASTTVTAAVTDVIATTVAPATDKEALTPGVVATVTDTVVAILDNPNAPVVDTVVAPVANTVVGPVVSTVVNTVVAPVVAPVVNTVVAPIVNTVVAPVLAPIVAPLAPVVAPIVAPLAPVLAPIVAPLAPALAPIVAPLAPVLAPILAPLAPVVAPITGIIGPLFGRP